MARYPTIRRRSHFGASYHRDMTELGQILQIVLTSSAADWRVLDGAPYAAPYAPEDAYESRPSSRWIYCADVAISLTFGNKSPAGAHRTMDWGLDRTCSAEQAEILFNGQPVYRRTLLIVENGSGILPQASKGNAQAHWIATSHDTSLARLVNELAGTESFDSLVGRAGIVAET